MSFLPANINKDGSKSALALGLIVEINTLRESGKYDSIKKPTEVPVLSKLINDTYHSSIKVVLNPYVLRNASMELPLINKNNIFFENRLNQKYGTEMEATAMADLYKSSSEALVGGLTKDDKLLGYYRTLKPTLTVSLDIFTSKSKDNYVFKTEGIVGIILHEIGHFINILKATSWVARGNFMQHQMNEIMMRTSGYKERVDVLAKVARKENIDIKEHIDELAIANNPKLTTAVMLGANAKLMRNELGNDLYDARGFEQLSDNFATLHGCGLDLVLALEGLPEMRMARSGTVERAMILVLTVVAIPTYPSLFLLLCVLKPCGDRYDGAADRIRNIAHSMTAMLKGNRGNDNKDLIRELEAVLKEVKAYSSARPMFVALDELIRPTGRQARSIRELNQHLNEFSNNKLYLAAAKYSNL